MLYKFKSKATGDLIMLQPHGQHILEIIGKHTPDVPSTQGILLPQDMPAALQALQAAIHAEEQTRAQAVAQAQAEHLPEPRFDTVSLRQRAHPFMDMLQHCLREEVPVVWGV